MGKKIKTEKKWEKKKEKKKKKREDCSVFHCGLAQ